jgi:xylulokinase
MAERDLFLGLDIGTTAIKAALFDNEGRSVAYARHPYATSRPGPGLVEQDSNDWIAGTKAVMDEVLAGGRLDRVAAVGICGQANTEVYVDATGKPLAPAMTWQDSRAAGEAAKLDATVTAAEKEKWWGMPMPIGASHILARMNWVATHQPEVLARTRRVLTPKDYCLATMAGVDATDPISNFCVVGKDLRYITPLIDRVDGAAERLAPLRSITDVVGEIALGSSARRAPVVSGTMDAWCGLIGAGVHRSGQGVYISGTSEILAVAGAKVGAPGIVTFPEAAGLSVHAGPTQSGGDALRWWSRVAGRDVMEVLALAGEADRAGAAIVFLPHLDGERAPVWDPTLRGAFLGLDSRAGGPEMALAVLEGVAMSARMLLSALDEAGGAPVPRMFHAGRGAQSDLWAQIRADCIGRPLDRVTCVDVGCLGAAVMAAVGIGAFPTIADAVVAMTRIERTFEPDARAMARYDAMYETYVRAIEVLAPHPIQIRRSGSQGALRKVRLG